MLLANYKWDRDEENLLGEPGWVTTATPDMLWVEWDTGEETVYNLEDHDLVKVVRLRSNEDLSKGDRVMLLATTDWSVCYEHPLGVIGEVTSIDSYTMRVYWDNGVENVYFVQDNDLIKVVKEWGNAY
jgi:hypothetical protein